MIAYSRAQKRKARKARGVSALYKQWNQEDESVSIEQREHDDPLRTVREARARQTGKPANDVLYPIFAEAPGRAILSEVEKPADQNRLWKVFLDYDTADAIYTARVIGRPRFPNVSKMEFMPERLEASASDRVDIRSDDQKHRDAVNAWMKWQGYLGHLTGPERTSIYRAARQMDELHKDGRATVHGIAFVRALRVLAGVVEGGGRG